MLIMINDFSIDIPEIERRADFEGDVIMDEQPPETEE